MDEHFEQWPLDWILAVNETATITDTGSGAAHFHADQPGFIPSATRQGVFAATGWYLVEYDVSAIMGNLTIQNPDASTVFSRNIDQPERRRLLRHKTNADQRLRLNANNSAVDATVDFVTVDALCLDTLYIAQSDGLFDLRYNLPASPVWGERIALQVRGQDELNYILVALEYSEAGWRLSAEQISNGQITRLINPIEVSPNDRLRVTTAGDSYVLEVGWQQVATFTESALSTARGCRVIYTPDITPIRLTITDGLDRYQTATASHLQTALSGAAMVTLTEPVVTSAAGLLFPRKASLRGGVIEIDGQQSGEQWAALEQSGDAITVENLTFIGDNVAAPVYSQNHHSALFLPHDQGWAATVRACVFQNLWGFSITGGGDGVLIEDSRFQNCGNGLNVNAHRCTIRRCTLIDAEGIESSGDDLLIEDCTLLRSGISAGGRQTLPLTTGQLIRRCTLRGAGSAVATWNNGIMMTDMNDGAWVEDCFASDFRLAFACVAADGHPIRQAVARRLHLTNSFTGIYCAGDVESVLIADSTVSGCFRGAEIRCSHVTLENITFINNTTDVYIHDTAQHVILRNCLYQTLTIEPGAEVVIE